MIKKLTILSVGVTTLLAGVYFYNSSNSSSKKIGFFENKNPYERKPASIGNVNNVVKPIVQKKKVTGVKQRALRLSEIKSCYTQKCDFASNDSREYDLTVGNSLKKELFDLYEETLKNEISDQRITDIGIEYLRVSNGHVKEAALLVLSTQEPSQEALNAITENVLDYHDANLVGLALMELEKYRSTDYQVVIRESFIKNFNNGSLMVKEALAKGIYKFVNANNREDYGEILNSLPHNSQVRKNLKASLDRYDYNARL